MNIRLMVGLFCAASVCAMGGLMTQAPVALAQGTAKAKSWVEFTADGKAKQPVGYRKWVFLGSPITPNDMNGGDPVVASAKCKSAEDKGPRPEVRIPVAKQDGEATKPDAARVHTEAALQVDQTEEAATRVVDVRQGRLGHWE